jgi:hypothetical protein
VAAILRGGSPQRARPLLEGIVLAEHSRGTVLVRVRRQRVVCASSIRLQAEDR